MKLPSLRRKTIEPERVEEKKVEDSFFKAVWSAPANYNRAARRSVKLFGTIWRWDARALGIPTDLPSRYTRRHFTPETFLSPKNRRQRKMRARVIRDLKQRGQA